MTGLYFGDAHIGSGSAVCFMCIYLHMMEGMLAVDSSQITAHMLKHGQHLVKLSKDFNA